MNLHASSSPDMMHTAWRITTWASVDGSRWRNRESHVRLRRRHVVRSCCRHIVGRMSRCSTCHVTATSGLLLPPCPCYAAASVRRGTTPFLCLNCDFEEQRHVELVHPPLLNDRGMVEGYTGCPLVADLELVRRRSPWKSAGGAETTLSSSCLRKNEGALPWRAIGKQNQA